MIYSAAEAAEQPSSSAPSDARLNDVKAPAGFNATLFAAPPNVSYPTCISAAGAGEVFVGVDQNGSLDRQPGRGWVVRCVDTNADGVADQFNVFARMDSPRGIVYDHHVLYVMHPPLVEAFYDDNGDGVADRSEVLVRGLARDLNFRGADHTCNGIRMGIDGWLYIALGDYGATNAVAKDGSQIQVHGGGIVRVRPDGSELEVVVNGTRNIYDVAIDPLLNLFTCDNTNDGDDWNVRLSHMIPTANYGYPTLFRHFSDEMIPTMVDYGGGSPTGALFLDEPGYPNGLGHGLYTCQWGWSTVTRHPLKAKGASFEAQKESFLSVPRPTGIDADGDGNLYVGSWKGAVFTYAGPNAGYVIQLRPQHYHSAPPLQLEGVDGRQLLNALTSPSAVRRWRVQREILRRGKTPEMTQGLEQLAESHRDLAVRVAAMFTLKQLAGTGAQSALIRMSRTPSLRPFAIRALADRKTEAADVPSSFFVSALRDSDPHVRLQAVIALNRLGRREAAADIMPLTADPETAIAHVAFRALVAFEAVDLCFKTVDEGTPALVPGAMRVLRNLHEPQVVSGLIERFNKAENSSTRLLLLEALCRLYYREADWDGSWWGTRPDTAGPYYKPVTWSQSEPIAQALKNTIVRSDSDTLRFAMEQLQRHRIDAPELTPLLVQMGRENKELRPVVVDLFAHSSSIPAAAFPFLEEIARSSSDEPGLRARAFLGLERAASQTDATKTAVAVLAALNTTEKGKPLTLRLTDDFVRDGRRARDTSYFGRLAADPDPVKRQIAYMVLLQIADRRNSFGGAKGAAQKILDQSWAGNDLPALLNAISQTHSTHDSQRLAALAQDPRPEIAALARRVIAEVVPSEAAAQRAGSQELIAKLPYDRIVAEASRPGGDPKRGSQLFETLACVKCHTVSKSEPPKGPFLGDISVRYSRAEIINSILRPSAQIAQGFVTTWVQTNNGDDLEGFVVRESGDELELRNLNGPLVVAKKDIAKRGTRTTSVMPEGLADQISPRDLASLLAYLESLKP